LRKTRCEWRTFPAIDVGGRAHLQLRAGPMLPSDRWVRGQAALVSVVVRPRARMLATAGAFVAWLAFALLFALVRLSIALICVASTTAAAALVLNRPLCGAAAGDCSVSGMVGWVWWAAIAVVGIGAAVPLTVAGWHFWCAPEPEAPTEVGDEENRLLGARDLFAPWRRIEIGDGERTLPGGRAASNADDLATVARVALAKGAS
jgi:hypothetical protein